MTRGNKRLLSCLLAGGLCVALTCGGLIFFAGKGLEKIPAVTASADAFMDRIKAKQAEPAYRSTTAEFQGKVSLDQFRAMVARYPALATQTGRSKGEVRLYLTGSGVRSYVRYHLENPSTPITLDLTLKEDHGSWKVESVNLQ